jgi:hypothetical protein
MTCRLPFRHLFVVTLSTLVASSTACGGDDERFDPLVAKRIETTVSARDVVAGDPVSVTCVLYNARDEAIVGRPFKIIATPSEGVIPNGQELGFTRTGPHDVACADEAVQLVDDTPERVQVRAGPAVRTTMVISPATIPAGDSADLQCEAFDNWGNVASTELRVRTEPAEGLTLTGARAATGTKTGSWELTCHSDDVPPTERGKATLTIAPGDRAGIVLTKNPDRPSYLPGTAVQIQAETIDAYGNLRGETIAVQNIAVTPSGSTQLVGDAQDRVRFLQEGRFTVSAEAKDIPTETATTEIVVDGTAPELVLELPPRGVVTDTLSTLRFKGTVTDNLGEIASLMIGETEVSLPAGGGAFDVEIPLAYGLNLFDVTATDPYGNAAFTTRGAERSNDYYPMGETRTFESDGVENAMAIVMTQDAIDDGNQDDGKRDDLASIIKFVLEELDFASFVTNPLVDFACIGGRCTIDLTTVTFSDVDVDMPLRNGRVGFQATLSDFNGTITLWFPCAVPVLCQTNPQPFPGSLTIDRIVMTSDIALSIVDGEVRARAENTDVDIGTIAVNITGDPTGLTSAAVNIALSIIGPYIATLMEAVMTVVIEDQVASAFGGLLSALALDLNFDLPSIVPNGAPNTLALRTQPRGLDIAPERLQLRMDAMATSMSPNRPHPHLGSIRHSGCAPPSSLTFPPPGRITVGVHDDFINQLLFGVWEGGTVNIALEPPASDALLGSFGFNGATLNVDALLPPVFNSCQPRNGFGEVEGGIIDRVQLAELYAEIIFPGGEERIAMWIMAEAPLRVEFGTNAEGAMVARLVIDRIEPMWIEVVANQGPFEGDDAALVDLVEAVLIPQLLGVVEENASFALPSIDLSTLTTSVPAGTTINLDIEGVGRDNGYMTVYGALE